MVPARCRRTALASVPTGSAAEVSSAGPLSRAEQRQRRPQMRKGDAREAALLEATEELLDRIAPADRPARPRAHRGAGLPPAAPQPHPLLFLLRLQAGGDREAGRALPGRDLRG